MLFSTCSPFRSTLQRPIFALAMQQEKNNLFFFCPFGYKMKLSWESFSVEREEKL